MVRFLISSAADKLFAALASFGRTATVEAEYGDAVVEGSILTLAHHGPRAGNPAPCIAPIPSVRYECACGGRELQCSLCGSQSQTASGWYYGPPEVEAVGLSHLDLDTLGGCAAILGCKPEADGFWRLAAFVDVSGPHKLGQSGASAEDIRRLRAYHAWAEANKVFAPRDGGALDVTEQVLRSIEVVERVCADDAELLSAGDIFAKKEDELNKLSFVEAKGGVVVRVCGGFANHLYVTPAGEVGRAVVALRTDFHACTVSLADPISGVSCRDIVQGLWGSEAGGHPGIAGGPRNAVMGLDELLKLRDATVAALAGK